MICYLKLKENLLEEEADITKLLKELKIEKDDFEITRDEEDAIVVGGRIVDDVLAKYVIGMDDESLITFLHMMRNLGMEEALQEFGVQDGDTVKIADVEFEYFEQGYCHSRDLLELEKPKSQQIQQNY